MFGNSCYGGEIPLTCITRNTPPPRSEPRGQEEKERRRNTRWLDGGPRARGWGGASGLAREAAAHERTNRGPHDSELSAAVLSRCIHRPYCKLKFRHSAQQLVAAARREILGLVACVRYLYVCMYLSTRRRRQSRPKQEVWETSYKFLPSSCRVPADVDSLPSSCTVECPVNLCAGFYPHHVATSGPSSSSAFSKGPRPQKCQRPRKKHTRR